MGDPQAAREQALNHPLHVPQFELLNMIGDLMVVTDHVEKLELRHMARVIQGLFAGSLRIAQGKATPVK